MIERSDTLFYWTETSLHIGSSSSVGSVDLPIQRNRQTGHPIAQYSGVKGVLRNHCKEYWGTGTQAKETLISIFGPEPKAASEFGGALSVSEARLLLFPVRSLRGVFAWITCPLALAFLQRDLARVNIRTSFPGWSSDRPGEGEAWVSANSPVTLPALTSLPAEVVLEEYRFGAVEKPEVGVLAAWFRENALPTSDGYEYWQDCMMDPIGSSHLIMLSDESFSELVEHGTDVVQRISIDPDSGTVNQTGLWTEENLPCDSLMYSVLHIQRPRSDAKTPDVLKQNGQPSAVCIQQKLHEALPANILIQMGGNATCARGLMRVRRLEALQGDTK